jgi:hypothetical protein
MKLQIAYPMPDYKDKIMNFVQWSSNKSAIPKNSEVVILQEFDNQYRLFIHPLGLIFNLEKNKVLIEDINQKNPLKNYGFT